uniref:Protein translocase subunit SecY n=3 Tax=16SrIII (X-disease group) TaxID=85623 RepID=A0A0K0TQ09_9MOLU|nr:SecY protein translocase ['Momordica charantia' witches'-broom phytoplasma]AMY60496.1 SecY protein translocase ['Allium porrum' stunting phytoplasma LeSt-Br03]AMY60499.1 SecY protein translocase ['Allium porrum' stunting phytoplasma LeSt-Br04]
MKMVIDFLRDKSKIIKKILFTLVILFIFVIGNKLVIPYVTVQEKFLFDIKSAIKQMSGLFEANGSIYFLSLGVYPYITASIIVQFAQKLFPFMKEWQEQGERGKYKTNLVTRSLTLLFAVGLALSSIQRDGIATLANNKAHVLTIVFFLVVGAFISVWLADLITSKGIGNGISIFVAISVSKNLFETLQFLTKIDDTNVTKRILTLVVLLILLILTVILSAAYLKVPITYATKQNNDKINNHIPLKLNTSGILSVILANSLLQFFGTISLLLGPENGFSKWVTQFQASQSNYLGLGFFVYLLLILLFSVFSTFITINPADIAEHLSKQDAYLEGVKPGDETVYKITQKLFKVTIIGAFALTVLAALPELIKFFVWTNESDRTVKVQLGGTSLLIVVGVAVEVMQRITTQTNVKKLYKKLF